MELSGMFERLGGPTCPTPPARRFRADRDPTGLGRIGHSGFTFRTNHVASAGPSCLHLELVTRLSAGELAERSQFMARLAKSLVSTMKEAQVRPHVATFSEARNNCVKGTTFLQQRRFAEAEASLRAALRLEPDDADVLNNLGTAIWEQGRAFIRGRCILSQGLPIQEARLWDTQQPGDGPLGAGPP